MTENIQKVPFSVEKIIQGMPEISYVFSKEGKLLTWNKNMEIIFGYSNEELHHKFVSEFIYEADKERVVKNFARILSKDDDKERTIEYRIKTKSGEVIPILALRSPIVVDGERYIIGIAINISKLKKNKGKLKAHVDEIIHLKNQLSDYYHNIEKMNQTEIELKDKLFLNAKNFNNKLIDNLPGIFYLYEMVDDKFFLKKWNKNYSTDLGYPDDEVLNMQPHQFFSKEEYKKAEKAISQIFSTGSTQVEIYTTHKNGKQIPYYYQGYQFEDNGKIFFMGVGIDISSRYLLEKEKQKTKEIIETKQKELIVSVLEISKTNKIIKHIFKKIDDLLVKQSENKSVTKLYSDLTQIRKELEVKISNPDNWEIFKLRFAEIHIDFFSNLKIKHPNLTKTELKYSAYLKIHLSSARIMSILNVSKEAIKKTRYRIRKKLDLSPKDSLEDYIAKF